jgi:hypothetical protein
MANKDAATIVEKYTRGVAGAGADYAAGVQNPSRPWAAATQQGAKRWAAGIQKAISDGSFQKGVAAAGDAKWQQNAATKGAQRYQGAAAEAGQAYAAIAQRVVAAGQAARNAVASMPDETQEQRLQRAISAMRATSNAWKGGR